jgi:nitrate reductase molybdenum cofactor assembly chaperone
MNMDYESMSHIPKVLGALSRLLSYPDEHTTQAVELLYVVLQGELADAADRASQFGAFCEQSEQWEIEEAFTRVFDVNPTCALEVGWHLFGEEYARGMFLVRMREEMRKYGLPESVELPDHLSHVLAVVAAMPDEEATRFVRACVQPAVEKMNQALADKDTPYQHVVATLASVIEHRWGPSPAASPDVLASRSQGLDPLRAYPVADVGCGSGCGGSCGSEVDVVPLDAHFPQMNKQTDSTATTLKGQS